MSYKSYIYNQLMQSDNIYLNISDLFFKYTNNDLHFDEFILNCQAINYKFFFDETKDMKNIKNLYINNDSNFFFIDYIFK